MSQRITQRGRQNLSAGSGRSNTRRNARTLRSPVASVPVSVGGAELKFTTRTLATDFSSVSTAQIPVELTGLITDGSGISSRIGRTISIVDFRLFGTAVHGVANSVSDDVTNVLRIFLVTHTPGSAPVLSVDKVMSRSNTQYLDDVYLDRTLVFSTPGLNSTGYLPAVKHVQWRVPVRRRFQYYTSSGVAQPLGLSIIMVSDSAGVPNPGFVQGSWTVTWTDV